MKLLALLRRLVGRQPRAADATPSPAAPARGSSPERPFSALLEAARARYPQNVVTPAQIFAPAPPPPWIKGPEGTPPPSLALDAGITEASSWAALSANMALGSFWTEGITFLGYAYLSELAQRPEYRVISETIATEMTRKWIRLVSKNADDDKSDRIRELDERLRDLNARDIFCRAAEQDGFFGRGHIYIDTGDTDQPDELAKSLGDGWDAASKAKIGKNSIKALRTVEAVWCYPTSYDSNDPLRASWYRPITWYVQAKIVHSSRLLTLIGREVPDLLKPTYSFGGLSMSQMAKPYVDNWLQTRQGVNQIINSFSQFVLMTNMQTSMQADGQELFSRAELFNLMRSNAGLMMLSKDKEDFKNVSAPLSGLEALQAQAQEHMAAVSHIPLVKLLGIQPAGLNASSEGELRAFYDYVHAYQEHLFRLPLRTIIGMVMLDLWGETDDEIDFEFVELWALDEKGAAEVAKTRADTDQELIDAGIISAEEARGRLAADANSGYGNIDVEDVPDLESEEAEGLEPVGGRPQPAEAEALGEPPAGKAEAA